MSYDQSQSTSNKKNKFLFNDGNVKRFLECSPNVKGGQISVDHA